MLINGIKLPRPLYIATVALGLAAGISLALRPHGSDENAPADVMKSLGFTDQREFSFASAMLEDTKIKELSDAQAEELDKLLSAKGMKQEVGYGILANLAAPALMQKYLPALTVVKSKAPDNPHIKSVLASWYSSGGHAIVNRVAGGSDPLSQDARDILKHE